MTTTTASKSLFSYIAAPFQMVCYAFVWFCCGYFIWSLLLKGALGDNLLDNFQNLVTF